MQYKLCVMCDKSALYTQALCCSSHVYCVDCIVDLYKQKKLEKYCPCCYNEQYLHQDCISSNQDEYVLLDKHVITFSNEDIITIFVFDSEYLFNNDLIDTDNIDEQPTLQTLDKHQYLKKLQFKLKIDQNSECSDENLRQTSQIIKSNIDIVLTHILTNINNSAQITVDFLFRVLRCMQENICNKMKNYYYFNESEHYKEFRSIITLNNFNTICVKLLDEAED